MEALPCPLRSRTAAHWPSVRFLCMAFLCGDVHSSRFARSQLASIRRGIGAEAGRVSGASGIGLAAGSEPQLWLRLLDALGSFRPSMNPQEPIIVDGRLVPGLFNGDGLHQDMEARLEASGTQDGSGVSVVAHVARWCGWVTPLRPPPRPPPHPPLRPPVVQLPCICWERTVLLGWPSCGACFGTAPCVRMTWRPCLHWKIRPVISPCLASYACSHS
jgi:hypothetical protein